jgi:oxygen-dependent protoporphyrinogen oxidase
MGGSSNGHGPADVEVVVLDAAQRSGGKLRAVEISGRPVDAGPDALLVRRPEAVGLLGELGLAGDLEPQASSGSFVLARGKLRHLPAGLVIGAPGRLWPVATSGIIGPAGLARASFDLLRLRKSGREVGSSAGDEEAPRGRDRTIGNIVRSHFGAQIAERLIEPLVGGIHAGSIDDLSAAAVFPPLLTASAAGGSLFRSLRAMSPPPPKAADGPRGPVLSSLRGGLWRMAAALHSALVERGAEIRLSTPVEALRPSPHGGWSISTPSGSLDVDGVVLATPAHRSALLLEEADPALGRLVGEIEHASIAVVTLSLAAAAVEHPLNGTGYLVPRTEGRLVTACTWLSSKWPYIRQEGEALLRASVGRRGDDRHTRMDDDELARQVIGELEDVLGALGEPRAISVTRWPDAFPQYRVGHLELVATAREKAALLSPPLVLTGAWMDGVGIPACIGAARNAVSSLLDRLPAARS